jgi:AbrB family looped-hinge helix DNA binding protein
MATATVTSKGQITIPAQVRASLGIDTGDRIEFVALDNGKFAIMAATHSVTDLKGLIRKPAKTVTIDDMNQAIAAQGSKAS